MSAITLPPPRRSRRPSLTPMIDVVFLLLVFFMLAARFGSETALVLTTPGGGATWDGPPRLVTVLPDGALVNGAPVPTDRIAQTLGPLMAAPSDPVLLRGGADADVQRVVAVIDALRAAGIGSLYLVE